MHACFSESRWLRKNMKDYTYFFQRPSDIHDAPTPFLICFSSISVNLRTFPERHAFVIDFSIYTGECSWHTKFQNLSNFIGNFFRSVGCAAPPPPAAATAHVRLRAFLDEIPRFLRVKLRDSRFKILGIRVLIVFIKPGFKSRRSS